MNVEIPLGLFFMVIIGTLIFWNMRMLKEGYTNMVQNQEPFLNGSPAMPGGTSFAPACGVQYPACPTGMRCINGYCGIPMQPRQPRSSGLPVIPSNSGGRWGSETLDNVVGWNSSPTD
jgi:hypothetical protein